MRHLGTIILLAVAVVVALSGILAAFCSPVIAAVILAWVTMTACLVAGWLLFRTVILRKSDKSFVLSALYNADVLGQTQEDLQRKAQHDIWRARVAMEEVSIKSYDGLKLHATIFHNRANCRRWVVICHGYAQIGNERLLFVAQTFHEMGYWVLMPDARGHGKSDGDYLGMGWLDRLDVAQWIHEIGRRNNVSSIVLYGISMGASTVLMAAGEPLPSTVKAIVADCGYASVAKECAYQLKAFYSLPAFPIVPIASLITRIFAGYWLKEASAVQQITKSKTPTLLIHGSADLYVPPSMMEELYNAAACPKRKLLVEGAGHGQSAVVDRTRYWQTITDFLATYE